MRSANDFEPPLDAGIAEAVILLLEHGIETFESCQGGEGHSYPEPTIRFYGDKSEGFKALAVALQNGLNPSKIGRVWQIIGQDPVGPYWEMTF